MIKGTHHTVKTKEKISKSCKGKKPSLETIEKRAAKCRGKKLRPKSEEEKQVLREKCSGWHHTEEAKKNISRNLRGVRRGGQTDDHIKKNREAHLGKKHSEETKKKMSITSKKRMEQYENRLKISKTLKELLKDPTKNSQWRGGISCEPYCIIWTKQYKNEIKERDENKCWNPLCRNNSKGFGPHHIDYIKKNCHPMNLITLCKSCNSRANFNRTQWKIYYTDIMSQRFPELVESYAIYLKNNYAN